MTMVSRRQQTEYNESTEMPKLPCRNGKPSISLGEAEPRAVARAARQTPITLNLQFVIGGPPFGKQRTRSKVHSARHITPKKTREYERHIGWLALQAISKLHFLDVKLWPTQRQVYLDLLIYHDNGSKPDSDNVVKAIADGCSGVLWHDDRNVLPRVWVEQWPSNNPRVEVFIVDTGYIPGTGEVTQ